MRLSVTLIYTVLAIAGTSFAAPGPLESAIVVCTLSPSYQVDLLTSLSISRRGTRMGTPRMGLTMEQITMQLQQLL